LLGEEFGTDGEWVRHRFRTEHHSECGVLANATPQRWRLQCNPATFQVLSGNRVRERLRCPPNYQCVGIWFVWRLADQLLPRRDELILDQAAVLKLIEHINKLATSETAQ
jgi:hypothetical protein